MKRIVRICLTITLLFVSLSTLLAQPVQKIRGSIIDAQIQGPLAGATVTLNKGKANCITEADGTFSFAALPIGTYSITVSFTGYQERVWDNIKLIAGKELVLHLALEPMINLQKEVIITAQSKANKPVNEMSLVSARAFTVEETRRYAASVNDPLRMATAFPGVISSDDGGNNIVIRGNSPTGLIWRMEGVAIPNPNHFSSAGSSGGGVSILSAQLLANSDFITGAFSAEYGNGVSGVFDLHLRKGNNEKREYTIEAGVLGLNLAMEGPFSSRSKGSYLVNYRYSTLSLLSKLGVGVGPGVTNFQDLSFHLNLPAGKWGDFSLFGFGGLSDQKVKTEEDQAKWETEWDRYNADFRSNTGVIGLKHVYHLNNNTRFQQTLSVSGTENGSSTNYQEEGGQTTPYHADKYLNSTISFASVVQHRVTANHLIKGGITLNSLGFNFLQNNRLNPAEPYKNVIDASGNTGLIHGHVQWQFKPAAQLTLNTGLHAMFLTLNNKWVLEPRAAIQYKLNNRSSIGLGYGMHSQVQPLGTYFIAGNKNLDFTKSQHVILSYLTQLNANWKFKTELYLQSLWDVPVSIYDTSSLSMLNVAGDYIAEQMISKGKGANYGVELSVERHLKDGFYGMLSGSVFQSKYKALDNIARNTRFNSHYLSTIVAGKEFVTEGRRKVWGVNAKITYAGGFWNTPIDVKASQDAGYARYYEDRAFSVQSPAFFRVDLRASIQWNYVGRSTTLSLDLQNALNRSNVYGEVYDRHKSSLETVYQAGILPVLNYKIEF